MKRFLSVFVAVGLLLAPVAAGQVRAVAVGSTAPKVVFIVGPAGGLTDSYRAAANAGVREARRDGADVVTVYSPNATWPAVRSALQGASIVVYLGHGNGWPSQYRDTPYPQTQNGLGLNPVAGQDDSAHQYFGEAYLARDIHLAPHAVVLLHHLCYASGNSEPGLAEGPFAGVQQRADNFAAGWLAAGAEAVLADTFFGPAWYIDAILGGQGTIESIWRAAPSFHDHVIGFPSTRSPGRSVLLDPTSADHGFYRSLVGRLTLRPEEVARGAAAVATPQGPALGPRVPSLVPLGVSFAAPSLQPAHGGPSVLVVGTTVSIRLPVKVPRGTKLTGSLELGARWDPIAVDVSAGAGLPQVPPAAPAATRATGGGASPVPTPTGAASPAPSGPAVVDTAADPPSIDAVTPETIGTVVTTSRATFRGGAMTAALALPATPGLYRLVTTIHDASGVAFDAPTQALIPGLIVRVSPMVSVAFGVVTDLRLRAGTQTTLAVRVANDGRQPWADDPGAPGAFTDPAETAYQMAPLVMAHWVAIGAAVDTSTNLTAVGARVAPGSESIVALPFDVPIQPGSYLVVVDLLSPIYGPLSANGSPTTVIRVLVDPADTSPAVPSAR